MSEFRVAGATACATCAEVAKSSDVVITILTADEQVEQVMLGQNGVIEGAGDGMLLIEISTISPVTVPAIGSRCLRSACPCSTYLFPEGQRGLGREV